MSIQLISNSQRDFVAEAQALGSTAKTRKGAIKALVAAIKKRRAPFSIFRQQDIRLGVNPSARSSISESYEFDMAAFNKRKSDPEAKRALHDKAFRSRFLSALRREEVKLIGQHPVDPSAAYIRLGEIARQRSIATGKNIQPVPARLWLTKNEACRIIRSMAQTCGMQDDWDGYSFCDGRGDYFHIAILNVAFSPDEIQKYRAHGRVIALVAQERRRVYAKSSQYRVSDRTDHFLVGQNENGNPFAHQVPTTIRTISSALEWIWSGQQIIARQGDIGIAPSRNKKPGEETQIFIGGGHSRHLWIGEVYQNGATHIRGGWMIHTGNQHPPVHIPSNVWRKVVVARRSEVGMSTRD